MSRRIVVTIEKKTTPVEPCPWVHHVGRSSVRCQSCKSVIPTSEIAAYERECNGDTKCALGRHVPRICEGCAFREYLAEGATLNQELAACGYTTEDAGHGRKHIMCGPHRVFTGTAGDVWAFLRSTGEVLTRVTDGTPVANTVDGILASWRRR